MKKCLKGNFTLDKYSGDLVLPTITKKSELEDIKSEIMSVLNASSFSTDINQSNSPETYSESIDKLISHVDKVLEDKKVSATKRENIKKYLNKTLQPVPLTKIEQSIQNTLDETIKGQIIKDDERLSQKFGKLLKKLFKNIEVVNDTRLSEFNQQMRLRTIIDSDNERIIDSDESINLGIIDYLNEQYSIIRDFLIDNGFDEKLIPKNLYISRKNITNAKTLVSNYKDALSMMYNYMMNNSNLKNELEDSWGNYICNKNEGSKLFKAVSAYINIVYFDLVLSEGFKNYIKINDTPEIINVHTTELASGVKKHTTTYKYKLLVGNSNAKNHWGDFEEDSLKTMADFSNAIISSIPVYDYSTLNKEFGFLDTKNFVGSITKLLDIGIHVINTNNTFSKAIESIDDNPEEKLKFIFESIFSKSENSIRNQLNKLGLDSNHLNYLYSIYKTVYLGKKSWMSIEKKYIEKNGFTPRYSLTSTITGIIRSNSIMNYLQTVYNSEEGTFETTIKPKFSSDSRQFDIYNAINQVTLTNQNKKKILLEYNAQGELNGKFIVTINGEEYIIDPTNILISKSSANKARVEKLNKFKELIDNNILLNSDKLLNGLNLSQEERELMNVIKFIDLMLGTTFHINEQGLRKLHLLLKSYPNALKNMFISSSRALFITKIYSKFEEESDKYSKFQFMDFWKDNYKDFYNIQLHEMSDVKDYTIKRTDGVHLRAVNVNEPWIRYLSRIEAILDGDTSKSVISNLEKSKIPNYSPAFLGAKIHQQISKSKAASSRLLFYQYSKAIIELCINTDVLNENFESKLIKNMTLGEMLYDMIVNKFIIPYLNDQTMFSQPTVYSDKTKFISYLVKLSDLGLNEIYKSGFNANVIDKMINSIGEAYKQVWNQVLSDYKLIFGLDSIEEIHGEMRKMTVKDLLNKINKYNEKNKSNVVFYEDTHYRVTADGKITINELLYHNANELYTKLNLELRLEKEKLNFALELLNTRTSFKVELNEKFELKENSKNPFNRMFEKLGLSKDGWYKESRVVIGKIVDPKTNKSRLVLYGKINLKPGEKFILNPILEKFFLLDNLIGNNLRLSLTGSEINHAIKGLRGFNIENHLSPELIEFIKLNNPNYNEKYQLTLFDVSKALQNNEKLIKNTGPDMTDEDYLFIENNQRIAESIKEIYETSLYKYENAAQNALFKRNVTIPGTIRHYSNTGLNEIGKTMNIAVIKDIPAKVFNFDGKSDNIDSHDGHAKVDPFTSILENMSLQDNEVGTVKKPLHHWYDDKYMTATLLKYAVSTITNLEMRLSEGNASDLISLRKIFKKMTNIRWSENVDSLGEIDLIEGCDFKDDPIIDFNENILNGSKLFYIDGLKYHQIVDFGIEDGVYYTEEQEVTSVGHSIKDPVRVYHYFDNSGMHHKSNVLLENTEFHTIDSLYELHSALGGIYSASLNESGFIEYSEASNYAVALYMIHVATIKKDANGVNIEKPDLTQNSYDQPLKRALINMVANQSAVKNGAGNINAYTSYYDDSKLNYITIGTDNYGIQMNSDHDADEAEMTEFSLVISSLDAGGNLHGYVKLIYETLGRVALQLSQIELDAVKEFRDSGNKSKLYDIVGRTIMNNLKRGRNEAGLSENILDAIEEEFNLNSDHKYDEMFIPFSDKNIYNTILSTFVSVINSKSIKRKYPGLGTVLLPGYNIATIYEIDGKKYLYEDILKKAQLEGITSEYTDLSEKNKDVVKKYLNNLLEKLKPITINDIDPTDNILVEIIDQNGIRHQEHISMNDIDDYYDFVDNPSDYMNTKYGYGVLLLTIYRDVTKPRNLAPAKLRFEIESGSEQISYNIYLHYRIKGLFLEIKRINDDKSISKSEKQELITAARKKYNPQLAFEEVFKGLTFELEDGTKYKVIEKSIKNKPAEIIMSNIYKSKFGIKDGDSLLDVLEKGENYFIETSELINSTNYDLAFTKSNNKNLYITFKPISSDNDHIDSTRIAWDNLLKRDYVYPENYNGERKCVYRVYAGTSDNIPLFEVGRWIIDDSVDYDPKLKKFVYAGTNKPVQNLKLYSYHHDKKTILKYVEFVQRYTVTERDDLNSYKYEVYNISKSKMEKVYDKQEYSEAVLTRKTKDGENYTITSELKFDEEIQKGISKILSDVYKTLDFSGILLNSGVSKTSQYILSHSLHDLGQSLKYNKNLYEHVLRLHKISNSGKLIENDIVQFNKGALFRSVNNYHKELSTIKYNSFVSSLNFTASRIPAQTLQSFMQMENVGFTGTTNNQCFVSHWQTWLQGSDYDIDKAYIMGFSFDGNGKFVGWSNLFNYDSPKSLRESMQLPFAKQKFYEKHSSGLNIDNYILRIEELVKKGDKAEEIKAYVALINYLNENESLNKYINPKTNNISYRISFSNPYGNEVLSNLFLHELTVIPTNLIEDANKNFISSHILTVIQNPVNMIAAYTPIEMGDLRSASNLSPKGDLAGKLTMLNPLTKMIMQYLNMTGKSVIGIAANGEKAAFMWNYYLNDVARNFNEKDGKRALFLFSTTRIKNRFNDDPLEILLNTLPDVNFNDSSLEVRTFFGNRMEDTIMTSDLMISQVLSAATDNAKELILAKINAGSKLAKIYLFLIATGFDIKDIVKFMTSPAISFIDSLSENNMFSHSGMSIDNAIKIANKDYSDFIEKHMNIKSLDKETKEKLIVGDIKGIKNPFEYNTYLYHKFEELILDIKEIESLRDFELTDEIKQDISEFENVLEGANEFSNLGRLLGMNLGLKTDKESMDTFINFIKGIMNSRISKMKQEPFDLDVKRFFIDEEYAEEVIDTYDEIKKCINIFDIFKKLPQYKAIGELFALVLDVDLLPIKSRIYDSVLKTMREREMVMTPEYHSRVMDSIGKLLIRLYVNTIDIDIPYQSKTKLVNSFREEYETTTLGSIKFDSIQSVASFKYFFENQLIPLLKVGKYYDYDESGNVVLKEDPSLASNQFIQSLIIEYHGKIPLYKCNMNMMTIGNSSEGQRKFQTYSRGLSNLKNISIGNTTLDNLFVLYNLIVNQNQYGSSRLTTLFKNILSQNNNLSILNNYLNYIGKLDWESDVDSLELNNFGILIDAAPIVTSEYGKRYSIIKLVTDKGIVLKQRRFGTYEKLEDVELIPIKPDESEQDFIIRLTIDTEYFILGGAYKEGIDRILLKFDNIDASTIAQLRSLLNRGILKINKECK